MSEETEKNGAGRPKMPEKAIYMSRGVRGFQAGPSTVIIMTANGVCLAEGYRLKTGSDDLGYLQKAKRIEIDASTVIDA